jgi:hypothetical protein
MPFALHLNAKPNVTGRLQVIEKADALGIVRQRWTPRKDTE